MKKHHRRVMLTLVVCAVVMACVLLMRPKETRAIDLSLLNLPMVDGAVFDAQRLSGRVVIINVWATWCKPCREEMPLLEQLFLSNQQKGVQFVGVSLDDKEKVAQFLTHTLVSYPILIDNSTDKSRLSRALGNDMAGVPYTLVVNSEGSIVFQQLGQVQTAKQIQDIIDALI